MLWVLLGGATMLLVCARCNTDTPNSLRTWPSLGDDGDDDDSDDDGDDDDGDDGDDGDDSDDGDEGDDGDNDNTALPNILCTWPPLDDHDDGDFDKWGY